MDWAPIQVQINHDMFDVISLIINLALGGAAVASLWFSRKALKKSEFDSAMNTSPSIMIRPSEIWVGAKDLSGGVGYGIIVPGEILKKNPYPDIIFHIEFKCLNVGRGAAFNISQPNASGMSTSAFRTNRTPLYQTNEDDHFSIYLALNGKYEDFYLNADKETPVRLDLTYTNDQNNIFCRSTWAANIRPFERDGEDLKVREVRLLKRAGKIEYSQNPFSG